MNLAAIVLHYEEENITDKTIECLNLAGITNITVVSRFGVGSMSAAFNQAAEGLMNSDYLWFLTDVSFGSDVPGKLMRALDADEWCAGIAPRFKSDHPFLNGPGPEVRQVPFIEWTAPMIRVSALNGVGLLDDEMPYDLFDLDWCHRAKQEGYHLCMHGDALIEHAYLRHIADLHPVSEARQILREYYEPKSYQHMERKWGKTFLNDLWPTRWDIINKLIDK